MFQRVRGRMPGRVGSHQVETMEAPRDALDETRHGDGYVLPELTIKYPKFVVERFISWPLVNTRTHTFVHFSVTKTKRKS